MYFPDDQMKAFLDAAPDAMVVVDERGTIVFVNVETEALFEYSRAELLGQPLEMLLPERFRDRHAAHVDGYNVAPRRRSMGAGLELLARRRDGTELPVEISLSPVTTAQRRFIVSAIRDVTNRRAMEHKLVEALNSAEQANKAKSAFLAAASHDLRQPLQTLTLLTSVLTRVVPMDSKAGTVVANQSEALHAMAELLNALLNISKLEAGVVKPDITDCCVSRIFARLRSEFAALAETKGLDLIVEDSNDVVRTDPALLSQIIQNLLANAIRYTREGWVRLRCVASLNAVRIEVADTGIGIPADELDLVFEEYYQTSRNLGEARQGVGLGLSIARRVASLLGCSLDVTSTLGRGSCFTIGVPRVGESIAVASEAPKAAPTVTANGALVLVIDDEVAVADATAMLLGTAGVDVLVAAGSQQAVDRIRALGRAPNLLICDYHLGRKETGVEAIRVIREATRQTLPTILVSGDTSTAIARTLSGVEGCHLLSKPVDAGELLDLSTRLLIGTGTTSTAAQASAKG